MFKVGSLPGVESGPSEIIASNLLFFMAKSGVMSSQQKMLFMQFSGISSDRLDFDSMYRSNFEHGLSTLIDYPFGLKTLE